MNVRSHLLAMALCPLAVMADDYPTLERVDHVLTCMRSNGGQTVDNLYSCACEIDVIAQQLGFDDFNEARTFEIYKRMPGEKGGLFRENERAKVVVGKLDAAREDAKKRCFSGHAVKGSKVVRGTEPGSRATPAEDGQTPPAGEPSR